MNSLTRQGMNGTLKGRNPVTAVDYHAPEPNPHMIPDVRRGFDPKPGTPGSASDGYYLSPFREVPSQKPFTPSNDAREQPYLPVEPYLAPIDMRTQRASGPGDEGYRDRWNNWSPIPNWGGRLTYREGDRDYKLTRMIDSIPPTIKEVAEWGAQLEPIPWANEGQYFPGPYEHWQRGEIVDALAGMGGLGMVGSLGAGETMTVEEAAARTASESLTAEERSDPSIVKGAFDLALNLYQQQQQIKLEEERRRRAEADLAAAIAAGQRPAPSGGQPAPVSKAIWQQGWFWPAILGTGLVVGYVAMK